VLLNCSGRSKENGYKVTIETPLLLSHFEERDAIREILDHAEEIAKEFGYSKLLRECNYLPSFKREKVMFNLQLIMDYERNKYYRFEALATDAPKRRLKQAEIDQLG
jgi:hypothetical protein